jgi:hypothetical protein
MYRKNRAYVRHCQPRRENHGAVGIPRLLLGGRGAHQDDGVIKRRTVGLEAIYLNTSAGVPAGASEPIPNS